MRKFAKQCFVWTLLLVVLMAGTVLATPNKEEKGTYQQVSKMKAKAFNEKDKQNDFRNYADADAVYWYPADTSGRVVGIVYDETTEDYLKNAWVENLELGFKIKTDKNGRFEINNLPDGDYTWIVKAPGYQGSTFAQFPVYKDLGATIFRFPLSTKRAINSNIKLEKELAHQHDHATHEEEETTTVNTKETMTTSDFTISSTHADWPTFNNFTVFYDNVIYQLNMNEYMYHVVASELWAPNSSLYSGIPANELLEGFKAQAVTARTYADYQIRFHDKHSGYDLCSTTHCQVYNPYYTNQMTVQAVDATENEMVLTVYNAATYDYSFVETVFSASCIGETNNNEDVWTSGSPIPYLRSVDCPYDIRPTLDSGHNVGLCQDGAVGYADAGYNYKYILSHYFTGTTVVKVNSQEKEVLEVGETRLSQGYITRDYTIQIRSTADYTFETSKYIDSDSTNSDTVIKLYDANWNLLGSDDDGAGNRFSKLTKNLSAGTYYLRVHDWNSDNTINYAVSVTGQPSLPLVQIGDSNTTANKGNYVTNVAKKVYLLNVDATRTYTIETMQLDADGDTYLKLYNASNGALIKEDDDSGTNRYSLISHYLYQSATYLLEVTTYSYEKNATPVELDCELRVY